MSFVGGGVSSQLSVTDSYLEATAKREGEPIGVLVLYDGSIPQMKSMADAAKRGVESVTGITVEMYRLPPDPASDKTVISSVFDDQTFQKSLYHKLESADGVLFGIPGQYGLPPAAVKKFFDSLGDRKAIGMDPNLPGESLKSGTRERETERRFCAERIGFCSSLLSSFP
mmetsp:Transcript_12890/g.51461  ORF Transcript_12890/g.51461 Transcript_12890/m.51461 type:complete len:170 (-) Transcript_12890:582-1091(-)